MYETLVTFCGLYQESMSVASCRYAICTLYAVPMTWMSMILGYVYFRDLDLSERLQFWSHIHNPCSEFHGPVLKTK